MTEYKVLAIDPGTAKCGVAVVSAPLDGSMHVCSRNVVQVGDIAAAVEPVVRDGVDAVVVGGGTGSKAIIGMLERSFPKLGILVVDEHGSTERARERYWHENPPRGWRRLVPRGLLTPPECYDDYAAVLLAEMVLAEMRSGARA